jgi:hypothetical protein
VRGKPGEFVRASQDLNQASLDHARLDAFIAAVRADSIAHPQGLRKIAPVLAHSLSIKLNEDCLDKIAEQQASCLVENREALVLNDVHTSSLTETLAGAPTDLALTVSATAAAGAGLYSPYIGVVRDLARVLGAFSNPQFSYLPTLAVVNGPVASLRLNTAPSFSKPKSVMVMAMPAIGADSPPQLRSTAPGPLCARSGPLVLPVEGAPLIFATGYAHDMSAPDRARRQAERTRRNPLGRTRRLSGDQRTPAPERGHGAAPSARTLGLRRVRRARFPRPAGR